MIPSMMQPLDRRAVLTAAVAVAGTTLVPRAAAAEPMPIPEVPQSTVAFPQELLHRTRALSGAVSMRSTVFPLTYLALSWKGSGSALVRLRTSQGWGAWRSVMGCAADRDDAPDVRAALLPTPGAVGYEVRAPAQVEVNEINTTDGPVRDEVVPEYASTSLVVDGILADVPYVSRGRWGARESLRFARSGAEIFPTTFSRAQTLTVHHTAGPNYDSHPKSSMRAIYFYHAIARKFGDIGYHLAVGADGTVYEGRWTGRDSSPVFGPRHQANGRPLVTRAAHTKRYNVGNIGIVLMGDFTRRPPTQAARSSLVKVLAALAGATGLNPLGHTRYVNPVTGRTKRVATLSGHRDWSGTTECPGDTFHAMLKTLRHDVADAVGGQ